MISFSNVEIWFATGSQHLYGEETLREVAGHSQEIVRGLQALPETPIQVVFKPVLTTAESIYELCQAANNSKSCIGLITWMHTFSPAKMWIAGLKALQKPFVHLHTQYNRELPWSTIDMDFMNLNQAAHGDREFGFIGSRMRLNRKVVVGFWQDADVLSELATWARAAFAWHDAQMLEGRALWRQHAERRRDGRGQSGGGDSSSLYGPRLWNRGSYGSLCPCQR